MPSMAAAAGEDDVTVLFEGNSVAQVEELLRKTRADIEKKKEDLRVMVGERYRDLIEAADTIAMMRQSAGSVCANITAMEGLCESLQQRGLIGFKTHHAHATDATRATSSGSHYTVAVQVKVLVAVPEILWGLTERRHYLSAAQLLLLAHHTHTALQLAPNAAKIASWFPVIERQWASIAQFRTTIVRGCSNLISSEPEDVQAVLDAVVGVMLVEGCGCEAALVMVLRLRHDALMLALAPRPAATAKAQLTHFVHLFLASLHIIRAVFAQDNDEPSLLERRLDEVVKGEGEEGAPITHLQESSLTLSFLPHSIRTFRASVRGEVRVSGAVVRERVAAWVDAVLGEAAQAITELLSFTTSVKALAMIRASVMDVCRDKMEQDWTKTAEVLYGKPLSPWDSLVREQVRTRARQVVASQLTQAKEAALQMMAKLADDIAQDPKVCGEEGDISGFVWGESAGDLPERVGWTCASARSVTQAGGLYYKTRGYNTRLQTVCRALNSRLTALLQDASHFSGGGAGEGAFGKDVTYGKDSPLKDEEERSAREDYEALLAYIQDTSTTVFAQLVTELEALAQQHLNRPVEKTEDLWEDECGAGLSAPLTVVVVAGRFCQALTNVCPQLQVCASATSLANSDVARRISLGSKVDSQSWTAVKTNLLDASGRLFGHFLKALTITLRSEVTGFLDDQLAMGGAAVVFAFPTWEVVDIEEEGEGGHVVKSAIHVPAHPTPALTHALTRVCTALNCVAAHTISRGMQSELALGTCEAVTGAYEEPLTKALSGQGGINQTAALQYIFDLRFITAILLPRDAKEVGSRLGSLVEQLEALVDPFDLDVFGPHITTRVRMAAHRLQAVLGAVVPRDRQVGTSRMPATTPSAKTSNNALPLIQAVEIPRFSNVPLPVTSSLPSLSFGAPSLAPPSTLAPKTSVKGQSSPSSTRREMSSAALSASRSAASLLSAMSSSWFGSSTS